MSSRALRVRHCEEPTGRANARLMTGSATKQSIAGVRSSGLLRFAGNDGSKAYFATARFALIAAATRLTGGRSIKRLTSLVAATSFAISTPVAMPMPSSM
jgi:hypothetical protein